MSVSGLFLVLFLTFHACMNMVAVFSLEAYDAVCAFLGANWYALVGTAILAGGFFVHMVVATMLTLSNQKARGENYDIAGKAPGVSWASKNMYIIGAVVILGIILHLGMFWAKMQFVEVAGVAESEIGGPTEGSKFICYYFAQPMWAIIYLIWLAFLWLHLNHGIWSAFHTIGLNNDVWMKRWKMIATVVSSVIIGMYAFTVLFFFVKGLMGC